MAYVKTSGVSQAEQGLSYNNRICVVSDSRGASGFSANAASRYLRGQSFYPHALTKVNGRAHVDPAHVFAVGGYSVEDFYDTVQSGGNADGKTLWQAAIDSPCDTIMLLGGVNGGIGIAALKAQFEVFATEAAAAGKRLIVLNEIPAESITSTRRLDHIGLNEWLSNPDGYRSGKSNVYVVDSWSAVSGVAENTFRQYFDLDLLHPNTIGFDFAGDPVAAKIIELFPYSRRFKLEDESSTGNLIVNPTLSGTGGTATATGCSGTVATSWKTASQSVTGLSAVMSKETDSNGIEWQVITLSGSPTDTSATKFFSVLQDIDEAAWDVGEEAALGMLVKWENAVNIVGITPDLVGSGDATLKARALDGYNATENRPLYPSSRGVRTMVTPILARAADATPESSTLTAGLQVQVSTRSRTIAGAYRLNNYVTITTTAAHGIIDGQTITIAGLTSDYNVTNGTVLAADQGTQLTRTIIAATRAGNIVTATTETPHRFFPGNLITVTSLTTDFNASSVRVLTTPTATTFTYTAAGADGTAADQTGNVVYSGTAGTQLTYFSVGSDGEAADNAGTLSPPVSGVIKFALPTLRLRNTSDTNNVVFQ